MIQALLQMVTDKEIASCVESLLRQAGLAVGAPSVDAIVRQLEAKLGVDLSYKASFIQDQIQLLLGLDHHPNPSPSSILMLPLSPTLLSLVLRLRRSLTF